VDYMTLLLVTSTAFLVVPVCVLLGGRRSSGALIITAGAALAASIIFWILLGGYTSLSNGTSAPAIVMTSLSAAASILLLAAWTLAIHAAWISRQRLWVLLLILTGYISILAMYFGAAPELVCISGATRMPAPISAFLCGEPNSVRPLLFDLAHVLGPAVVLIYALVAVRSGVDPTLPAVSSLVGERRPPPGLYVSPITTAPLEEDTEPNLH